jgi:hypothetical protein
LRKIFYSLIVLAIIISSFPLVSAQLTLGEPASQKLIKITIGEQGEVHVLHEIKKNNNVVQVDTIDGTVSNIKVIDKEGNNVEYGTVGLESITGITIFPSKEDVIIEYDLGDALFYKDGMWVWDFFNEETTTIIFPKGVDLVFVNNSPILLQDAKGITCYGRSQNAICDANIEYVINESTNLTKVQWEGRNFVVGIRTLTEISSFNFDQPTKSMSFNVNGDKQLITLIIPLEFLWNPYEVYLDDQKILKHEFFSNSTHVWLNIRPENSGTIRIIGTSVVPEFPLFVPFFIGISAVILLQLRNKLNLR